MNPHELFREEVKQNIEGLEQDKELQATSLGWVGTTAKHKYTYNFSWMGRPIIQFPQDMIAMQEIIWSQRPDVIIETGIAHGGSLVFYASMLELIGHGEVVGVDIDIRQHNREAIEAHPMSHRIHMIQGSSIDPTIVDQVRARIAGKKVLVVLDSNHTHEHVLEELRLYAPLVSVGSYCVVMDTVVEDMPEDAFPDRPWGKGDNPKTAVWAYLKENRDFEIDSAIHSKLLITVAPDGYLRRVG
ncbi:cephalosporin hydroxylase family protein [Pseudomonas sp. RTC3]|uniref:cephalosporin hydroxylase family protein n=1 Tax=unclassified Pseudomonas TaxID=196821 RepID=UPI002AB5D105|nr:MULTISPECIES: cephalosporin hydroxylase family protein [unclassified Pseudomonas]MEB0060891.1 cephalosporin hydroxylase family protein [Pseudomonas sp. RTC3]MDY7563972.1 cephalosporin hydroxylase family protein [Pseudomonas sp. 5C2]MEB0006016.1 cephalosporin hydroxylase family protein [Pseudomonas sp. RTB2]MEB0018893.1 cephalosporin hydroxylase family protein [Pseudomonas sp. RTB3]MEB0025512.1 cephalosporin hydroxylase family protein [Pseudomonas sp. MH9.2]